MARKQLSIEDLSYLSSLLSTSLPLSAGLNLIKTRSNEKCINELLGKLDNGVLIEEAIGDYLPKNIKGYLLPMVKEVSFNDALQLSLEFDGRYMALRKDFLSKVSYPFLLVLFSLVGLMAFDAFGLDSIISILKMFGNNGKLLSSMRVLFRVVAIIIYLVVVFGIGIVLYGFQNSKQAMFYIFISKHFPDSLLHIFFCQEFISLYLICAQKGYKTKDTLNLLMRLDNRPIISFLAFHLDESLLAGNSLREASIQPYFDTALTKFIRIGSFTLSFNDVLKSYVDLANARIQKAMKKTALAIQLSVYIFIGLLVALIYQILFMPMKALASF